MHSQPLSFGFGNRIRVGMLSCVVRKESPFLYLQFIFSNGVEEHGLDDSKFHGLMQSLDVHTILTLPSIFLHLFPTPMPLTSHPPLSGLPCMDELRPRILFVTIVSCKVPKI